MTDLLTTEPVSLILCDDAGVVLERRTMDAALARHLDRVWLAPGFSYAERVVGTNGIGTALESRGPASVFGPEHWAEGLEDLACAAVPVRHPVTGRIAGVLDLTCWRRDANRLLLATATLAARQVEQGLRDHVGRRESAVMTDFLLASRRTRHPVVAVSGDAVILDDAAREHLDPGDHDRIVTAATEVFASGRPARVVVDLSSGVSVRLDCRPTWTEAKAGGGVVVVLPGGVPGPAPAPDVAAAEHAPEHPAATPRRAAGSASVAVGGGTHWAMCRQTVDRYRAAGEWLVLRGEPGAGRRTLARAAARAHAPTGRLRVLDAADADPTWPRQVADELVHRHGTLIVSDVHRLPAPMVQALMETLEPHRWSTAPDRPWVVVTVGATHLGADVARLVERLPATVDVPPLRHHPEDVPDLVRHLLGRLGHPGLAISAEALRVLGRYRWPGNVGQLEQVLGRVVARRRAGVVGVDDLPPELFSGVRRLLTPVEALECDAIVGALRQSGGNKTKAAALLGLSRATVYRKVREYGISLPAAEVHG